MAKRRERTLKELYNVMPMVLQAEITPVLRGSYGMQGPIGETDYGNQIDQESKTNFRGKEMSEASEYLETHSNLSCAGTVAEDHFPMKAKPVFDQTLSTGDQRSRNNRSHDETNSCISGSVTANQSVGSGNGTRLVRKNVICSSVSVSCLGPEDFGSTAQYPASGSLSTSCDVRYRHDRCKDSAEILSKKLDILPGEAVAEKQIKSVLDPGEIFRKSVMKNGVGNLDSSFDGENSNVPEEACPKLVSEMGKSDSAQPHKAYSDKNEQSENSNDSVELPGIQETPLQSASGEENDDIVEHDVKVCDICGDAGREDLLAICSRCSDGAEHTYCMREMLDRVPEGVWLCEECKSDEDADNREQQKLEMVGGNENNICSESPSTVHSDVSGKLDDKDTDAEVNRTTSSDIEVDRSEKVNRSLHASVKRRLESSDIAPAAKRQFLETASGSPKASSPHRTAALSRHWSFKNLDKGKLNASHQLSSRSIDKIPESARSLATRRLETPKGTLSKSNSFSTSNLQPKVKPVDEVLSQKQMARGPAKILERKEGTVRSIGKSMSFKSVSSGRPNATEAKVKMLSPRASHVQELKGFKQTKERNNFEKKNSFRLDHSTTSSSAVSTLKGDQKFPSSGEANFCSNGVTKSVQTDGRINYSSKLNNCLTRKGSEIQATLGDVKRQSLSVHNSGGASPANGTCISAEHKRKQASIKDEPLSSSADKTSTLSAIPQDGLPQSWESTNQGERFMDNASIRSRHSVTTGEKSLPGQKGKEAHYSAQIPSSMHRASANDTSNTRGSTEQIGSGNGSRLKAAIAAAMLKRSDTFRKNRLPDVSDEVSVSSSDVNCEKITLDHSSLPNCSKNMVSGEGIREGQASLQTCISGSSDSYKQPALIHAKGIKLQGIESEFSSRPWNFGQNIKSDGKVSMKDLNTSPSSSAVSLPLKISVIPEHDFIWQGGFEVRRSGKPIETCSGIQAHLSTCASPKVLEAVCRFPEKVPLSEVARLSAWPTQFHDSGAKDDNIALYFFANDLESYERNYKRLLESMMKNDLALKGNFDGVELLIFPSNHLPEKSQRWNMLYFLWGVFRGSRVHDICDSSKKLHHPSLNAVDQCKNPPAAVISMPESLCSLPFIDGRSTARERPCSTSGTSNSSAEATRGCTLSSETVKDNFDANIYTCDQMPPNQQKFGEQDLKFEVQPLLRAPTSTVSLCSKADMDSGPDRDRQPSAEVVRTMINTGGMKILDREKGEVNFRGPSEEGDGFTDLRLKEGKGLIARNIIMTSTTLSMTEPDVLPLNHKKRMHSGSAVAPEQSSARASHTTLWNDTDCTVVGRISKKPKTDCTDLCGSNSSSDVSSAHLLASSLGANIRTRDGTENFDNSISSEKHFFPLDLQNMEQSADVAASWKVRPSADEDGHLGGSPNLELALGAETKPAKQGILPFFVGMVDNKSIQDKPPDKMKIQEKDEDAAAALSLSLSFPFSDERTAKPVTRSEQILPERHRVNTSLLLFGGFPDS